MKITRAVALKICQYLNDKKIKSKYRLEKDALISHTTMRRIINEEYDSVSLKTIAKICYALNIELKEFFDDKNFKIEDLDIFD